MAFSRYAEVSDISTYASQAFADLWESEQAEAKASLDAAAREMNERFRGLDRFSDSEIPFDKESDEEYAQILKRLNVYEAMWARVLDLYAGEAFDDIWAWLRAIKNNLWEKVEDGAYSFGGEPEKASSGSKEVYLGRAPLRD